MKADNLFAVGQQFYVEPIRGNHFIVTAVRDNEAEVVDTNERPWMVEIGEQPLDSGETPNIAMYPSAYGAATEVELNELHFEG